MDLDPNDDQRALQEMIARFAADRFPTEVVRSFGEPDGFDRDAWRELAELGTFGISVPEERGGVGLGAIESVLVHETLGAALTPGPLLAATLAASVSDGVLDGSIIPGCIARPHHGPILVEHALAIDVLYIVDDTGVQSIPATDLAMEPAARPTDPTTTVARLASLPVGETVADGETARSWRLLGSILASAEMVGNAEASTALAVEYAKEREQFGRPVGSFQGLKHLLADSYARTEVARSAVWAAGVTFDEPDAGDLERAAAGARIMAARAATENAKTCVQVHGGMGFTWEVDAHLFLKRAWLLETVFGSVDEAAEQVADAFAAGV
jgi:alkylation response protein AidB-like acyl-CoA dehydrogenase